MQKINAKELLKKYREGNCSDKELALLEEWYNHYSPAVPAKLTDQEWAEDVFSTVSPMSTVRTEVRTALSENVQHQQHGRHRAAYHAPVSEMADLDALAVELHHPLVPWISGYL